MGLSIVTPPTETPVTLAEAKAHCRVTSDAEDALITTYIKAATSYVERQVSMSLMTRTYMLTLDTFADNIILPGGPVSVVTEVRYIDTDGAQQVLDAEYYTLDASGKPVWLVRNDGYSWPSIMNTVNAVEIEYTAGADELPEEYSDIKAAVLLLVGHWYANREAVSTTGNAVNEVPLAVDALLQNYRWVLV